MTFANFIRMTSVKQIRFEVHYSRHVVKTTYAICAITANVKDSKDGTNGFVCWLSYVLNLLCLFMSFPFFSLTPMSKSKQNLHSCHLWYSSCLYTFSLHMCTNWFWTRIMHTNAPWFKVALCNVHLFHGKAYKRVHVV